MSSELFVKIENLIASNSYRNKTEIAKAVKSDPKFNGPQYPRSVVREAVSQAIDQLSAYRGVSTSGPVKGLVLCLPKSKLPTYGQFLAQLADKNSFRYLFHFKEGLQKYNLPSYQVTISKYLKENNITLKVTKEGYYYKSEKIKGPTLKDYYYQIVDKKNFNKTEQVQKELAKTNLNYTIQTIRANLRRLNIRLKVPPKSIAFKSPEIDAPSFRRFLFDFVDKHSFTNQTQILNALKDQNIKCHQPWLSDFLYKENIKIKVIDGIGSYKSPLKHGLSIEEHIYKLVDDGYYASPEEILKAIDIKNAKELKIGLSDKSAVGRYLRTSNITLRVSDQGIVYRSPQSNCPTFDDYLTHFVDEHNFQSELQIIEALAEENIEITKRKINTALNRNKITLKVTSKGHRYASSSIDGKVFDLFLQDFIDENNFSTPSEIKQALEEKKIHYNTDHCVRSKLIRLNISIKIDKAGEVYRSNRTSLPSFDEFYKNLIHENNFETHEQITNSLADHNIDKNSIDTINRRVGIKKIDGVFKVDENASLDLYNKSLSEYHNGKRTSNAVAAYLVSTETDLKDPDDLAKHATDKCKVKITKAALARSLIKMGAALKVTSNGVFYRPVTSTEPTFYDFLTDLVDQNNYTMGEQIQNHLKECHIHYENTGSVTTILKQNNIVKKVVNDGYYYKSSKIHGISRDDYLLHLIDTEKNFTSHIEFRNYIKNYDIPVNCSTFFSAHDICERVTPVGLIFKSPQSGYLTLKDYLITLVDEHDFTSREGIQAHLRTMNIDCTLNTIGLYLHENNITKKRTVNGSVFRSSKITPHPIEATLCELVDNGHYRTPAEVTAALKKLGIHISKRDILSKHMQAANIELKYTKSHGLVYRSPDTHLPSMRDVFLTIEHENPGITRDQFIKILMDEKNFPFTRRYGFFLFNVYGIDFDDAPLSVTDEDLIRSADIQDELPDDIIETVDKKDKPSRSSVIKTKDQQRVFARLLENEEISSAQQHLDDTHESYQEARDGYKDHYKILYQQESQAFRDLLDDTYKTLVSEKPALYVSRLIQQLNNQAAGYKKSTLALLKKEYSDKVALLSPEQQGQARALNAILQKKAGGTFGFSDQVAVHHLTSQLEKGSGIDSKAVKDEFSLIEDRYQDINELKLRGDIRNNLRKLGIEIKDAPLEDIIKKWNKQGSLWKVVAKECHLEPDTGLPEKFLRDYKNLAGDIATEEKQPSLFSDNPELQEALTEKIKYSIIDEKSISASGLKEDILLEELDKLKQEELLDETLKKYQSHQDSPEWQAFKDDVRSSYEKELDNKFTQSKPATASGGNSSTSGGNKLDSSILNDSNLKSKGPGLVQGLKASSSGTSSLSLSADPLDHFSRAVNDLASDFSSFVKDQWAYEKKQVKALTLKTKQLANGLAHKTIAGVKATPSVGKQAFKTTLIKSKAGLSYSVKGGKLLVKNGVYFMPQMSKYAAKSAMGSAVGVGFVLEGARTLTVYEASGGNKAATAIHAGLTAGLMVFTSETPYALGMTSKNFAVSTGSRFMLGGLRFIMPAAVGYGLYKTGTFERSLNHDIPDWAAERPQLMQSWYVPYISETAAWAARKAVQGASYVAIPYQTAFIENGVFDGYASLQGQKVFKDQLKTWQASSKAYQDILKKKDEYKKRITSFYDDPALKEKIGHLFEMTWAQILFPQTTYEQNYIYKNSQGDYTLEQLTDSDKVNYFSTGNEIYVSSFETQHQNGKVETCYYTVKSGHNLVFDQYGNVETFKYILSKEQFDYLNRLSFKIVCVSEEALLKLLTLDQKRGFKKDLSTYVEHELSKFLSDVGINPSVLTDPSYKPNRFDQLFGIAKLQSNKNTLAGKIQEAAIERVKSLRANLLHQETAYRDYKTFIDQSKAFWLKKHSLFTQITFDNSSLLPNQEGVVERQISSYGLYAQDNNLNDIYYIEKSHRLYTKTYRQQLKNGKSKTVNKKIIETLYTLYDNKGNELLSQVPAKQLQTFKEKQNREITFLRSVDENDIELLSQHYTMINPYSGITSQKTSYQDMRRLVGDMNNMLIVNKVKLKGKPLFTLTHYATNTLIALCEDVNSLYNLFSSDKNLRDKYVLAKPYEVSDRKDFETQIIAMRSRPGEGIYTRYETTSMEASDIVGDVFRLQAQENTNTYRLISPSGRDVFNKQVTLKEVDLYLANYHTKAIITLGAKDKNYLSKQIEQLGQYLLHAKITNAQAIRFFHIPGKIVWRVDNDRIDNNPNSFSYFMRDYRNKKDTITSNVKDVQKFIGMDGILSAPKTPQQGLIYKDIFGKTYNNYIKDNHYIPKNWVPVNKQKPVFNDNKQNINLMKKEH